MAACRLCRRQEPTLAEILLALPFPTRIGGSTAGRTWPPAEVVAEIGPAGIVVSAAVVGVDDDLSERRGCRAQCEHSGKPAANRYFPEEVRHSWLLESPMHVVPTRRRQLGFRAPSGRPRLAKSRRDVSRPQQRRDAEFRPLPRRNPAPRRAARRRSRNGLRARGLVRAPQASRASLRAMD